jgi:hypothetical protein
VRWHRAAPNRLAITPRKRPVSPSFFYQRKCMPESQANSVRRLSSGAAACAGASASALRPKPEGEEFSDNFKTEHLRLHFCPISLGHPRAEWILLPRRAAAFWEGPEGFTGRNRESRRREDRRAQELSRSRAQGDGGVKRSNSGRSVERSEQVARIERRGEKLARSLISPQRRKSRPSSG